eukprot:TRINITY_DN5742_c0_g2_i2.p2 TRINITY_DN5742_c0_g2~~TRINITY_DN5742_c0_g2_i2.p2  ORF type:complete len:302 (-),score=19.41 TRINITY_DN5742_c0_g2_i2:58-882(-)
MSTIQINRNIKITSIKYLNQSSQIRPIKKQLSKQIVCSVAKFRGRMYKTALPDIRLKIEEDYQKSFLHNEILQYSISVGLTKQEKQKRLELVQEICNVLQDEFPKSKIQSFGSFDTDLMLHTSAIDIGITNVIQFRENQEGLVPEEHTRACQILKNLIPTFRKRFPSRLKLPLEIVPQRNPQLEIKIDFINIKICFLNVLSLEMDKYIVQQSQKFWQFKPLALMLKAMFREKKLLGDLYGGISPYCLYLLIITHIIMTQKETLQFCLNAAGIKK